MADYPSIALVEYASIATGTRATDALAKKAPVAILRAGTFQPGRFAVLFGGDVASVEESFIEAVRVGADSLFDRVLLPDCDPAVQRAALGHVADWNADTIGIIETSSLAATIEAADAAVKGAGVRVVQIRLGDGLGGKGLVHFAGLQADVEAAIEIGAGRANRDNRTVCTSIIPRIDGDVRSVLRRSTSFSEGRA